MKQLTCMSDEFGSDPISGIHEQPLYQTLEQLPCAGGGHFSRVYVASEDSVIKLARRDGTLHYLQWCLQEQSRGNHPKYTPLIHKIILLPDDMYLVHMEKYSKLNYIDGFYLSSELETILLHDFMEDTFNRTVKNKLTQHQFIRTDIHMQNVMVRPGGEEAIRKIVYKNLGEKENDTYWQSIAEHMILTDPFSHPYQPVSDVPPLFRKKGVLRKDVLKHAETHKKQVEAVTYKNTRIDVTKGSTRKRLLDIHAKFLKLHSKGIQVPSLLKPLDRCNLITDMFAS